MKHVFPLAVIVAVLTVSGCLAVSPEAIIASSPVVQNFLKDYPNAQIKATFYSEEEAAQIIDQIKADCEKDAVTPKDYYRVTITDEESGLSITAWIDWSRQLVECAIKKGTSGEKIESYDKDEFEKGEKNQYEEKCRESYQQKCYEGHVYKFDACGNKVEKVQYCDYGCENGACVDSGEETGAGKPADGELVKKCHEGHVYLFDDEGNLVEKLQYCEHGCENATCIEEGDEAEGELICCESFGYGAEMVKCCETYEWTTAEECAVPEAFVGGGKQVVDDSYCEETCYESDEGYNVYKAGVAEAGEQRLEDHCNDDGTLTEKYCEGGEIKAKTVPCPGGYKCIEGACVLLYDCTDTDDSHNEGINYYIQGTVERLDKGVVTATHTDYCGTEGVEAGSVREYYCEGNNIKSKLYKCAYGCVEGACLKTAPS